MIGLVFAGGPRNLNSTTAAQMLRDADISLTRVGLFLNPPDALILDVLERVDLDMIQFHGTETPEYCESFGKPWFKALPAGSYSSIELLMEIDRYKNARAVILDAHEPGQKGGRGETLNWQSLPKSAAAPIMLAGGLNPDNVGEAIRVVQPAAVDVSSGVESAPGIKDHKLMQRFIQEVRNADNKSL